MKHANVATQEQTTAHSYRVLMIAPTSFFADYGCHVRILEEARTLESLGHSITIATYHNGKNVAGIDIKRSLPIPWRQDYEVGSSRHKIVFDMLLGLKTLQLLARNHFDIIHAHLHEGALMGLVLGRMFNVPVVFDFQGSLTEEMIDHQFLRRNSALYGSIRRLEEWIDHRSSVILTSSGNAERILIDEFSCDPAKIRTVPDCVNTDVFRPADAYNPALLADMRLELGIPADAKVIVYLGLLAEYQGTSLLLEATHRIVTEHPSVYLLLMGFPGVDVYQHKANLLGISNHVRFTGRVPYEDAPIHLALGDVAVAPKLSVTEGSGKLLNYMAMALPTVAFDTPVAHEYLGEDGYFAERGNVDSLVEQIKAALALDENADSGVALRSGTHLRERAIERYDWRDAAHMIEQAYAVASGTDATTFLPS